MAGGEPEDGDDKDGGYKTAEEESELQRMGLS